MEVKLVPIGGSQGFRVPKPVLAQIGEAEWFDLSVENNALVFRPKTGIRRDWEKSFEGFGSHEDEKALLLDFPNNSDEKEWQW